MNHTTDSNGPFASSEVKRSFLGKNFVAISRFENSNLSILSGQRQRTGRGRKCRQAARPFAAWGILALLIAAPVWPQKKDTDLAEKSLEDLMNIKVTSVSKKEQKLSRVAAAIFVITQEDIRRSGATNIPDLLRMVPGLDVGQINGSTWAISSRGFNAQFSNKLLVMIDGRIVYTPNFAGVYWDTLDLPLEDRGRNFDQRGWPESFEGSPLGV